MPGPDIRLLTLADLDGAFALSSTAGWNQRAEDWRMLLRLAPSGAFAAEADSGIVGTAIALDYGLFAWIAMMLVNPAWRGRGLGARLLEAALEAVPPGRPVRLDATPLGRPLYERHGFADESVLTRHTAERPLPAPPEGADHRRTRPLTDADMPRLLEVDGHVFAGSRGALLEWARSRRSRIRARRNGRRRSAILRRTAGTALRPDWPGCRVESRVGTIACSRVARGGDRPAGDRRRLRRHGPASPSGWAAAASPPSVRSSGCAGQGPTGRQSPAQLRRGSSSSRFWVRSSPERPVAPVPRRRRNR